MKRIGRIGGNYLRLPFLVSGAVLISMGIFALIPLLLRQTSRQTYPPMVSHAFLIPIKPAPTDNRRPEDDPTPPEPPEPEIEVKPPDIPKIEPLESDPPEVTHEPMDMIPLESFSPEPPQVQTPPLHAVSLSAFPAQSSPMNLKVNLKVGKAPMPKAVARLAVPPKPATTGMRFGINEVDQKPISITSLKPHYPFGARRRGIEGYVTVQFLVDRNGRVRELTILDAEPPGIFDRTVRKTVSRWRFKPGEKIGQPVDTWVEMTIQFQLGDDA